MEAGTDKAKKYEKYITNLLEKVKSSPGDVDKMELLLARKYIKSQNVLNNAFKERNEVSNRIRDLQNEHNRLAGLIDTELGKSSGFLESLVAVKFGEDNEEPMPRNRKERRAMSSKAKKKPQKGANNGK